MTYGATSRAAHRQRSRRKVVWARLRHASAKTTLDTCARLWPDSDESTRTAIDAVMQERAAKEESDSAAE